MPAGSRCSRNEAKRVYSVLSHSQGRAGEKRWQEGSHLLSAKERRQAPETPVPRSVGAAAAAAARSAGPAAAPAAGAAVAVLSSGRHTLRTPSPASEPRRNCFVESFGVCLHPSQVVWLLSSGGTDAAPCRRARLQRACQSDCGDLAWVRLKRVAMVGLHGEQGTFGLGKSLCHSRNSHMSVATARYTSAQCPKSRSLFGFSFMEKWDMDISARVRALVT